MKIKLLLLALFATQLFSLTITLNSAKIDAKAYSILHIKSAEPFKCHVVQQGLDKKVYLCKFDKVVKTSISPKNMLLVDIDFLEKERDFYIRIAPKVGSRLMQVKTPLFLTHEVGTNEKREMVNHWTIILYENSPFPLESSRQKINFPIIYPKPIKPFVGALDLSGEPISYAHTKDIELYLNLKKSFENGRYLDVIEDSVDILKRFPNTIFRSEFLLYQLRAIDRGLDKDDDRLAKEFDGSNIASKGKAWIRAFPSDANIPEVLMLISKAYLSMGFNADASYFLDILVTGHEHSPFTKKAILIFADSLYSNRQKDKAIRLYKDVLYSAQDLDIAASAAIRLGDRELSRGKLEQAKEYLQKVLEANREYLLQDRVASYALATKLAQNGLYNLAAQIADTLVENLPKRDESREALVRDSGLWHAEANSVQKAHNRLQQYLEEYKFGEYRDEVQDGLDRLFFDLDETNATKLEKHYTKLIERHDNEIGDRALREKAKLFLSQSRYEDVLEMQDALEYADDTNATHEYILSAANALVGLALKDDRCTKAVKLIERYSLNFDEFDRGAIFECFARTARFEKAKELSEKQIKDGNLKERHKWMQRHLFALYSLNMYASVVSVGEDIVKISKSLKVEPLNETLRMIFFSFMKLEKLENAIETAKTIEKNSPNRLKNSDIYMQIVQHAQESRNDLLLVEYAKKIVSLQKTHNAHIYTPEVELALIGALQRLKNIEEALVIAKDLLQVEISLEQKIRAYYSAGELSMKLDKNEDAKKYFERCVEIEAKSPWRDICKQSLKLL